MSLSTLFDRIAGKQQERQQAREADFRALVIDIADGKDPDPDFVDHVLVGNQRNLDDLRSAVELLVHRRELRATYDKAGRLEKERKRIEREVSEADELLDHAEQKHEDTTAPLFGQLEEMKQASYAANRARNELWNTCSYPELVTRLKQVSERLGQLQSQHADTMSRLTDLRHFAENDRREVDFAVNRTHAAELNERADRYEKQAKKKEAEAAELSPQIEELEKEEQRIREQMLDP